MALFYGLGEKKDRIIFLIVIFYELCGSLFENEINFTKKIKNLK